MKYKYLLLFFLLTGSTLLKAQPPETTYAGTVVYEGYYDDRAWGPFNIGFNFTFYGNTYSQFYVTSNGLVMFGSGSNDYTEDPIPSASSPNNFIAAFWDDIVINPSGRILYTTIGAAPNRKCIIQWTNMGFYSSTVLMGTFSAILYEGSNKIQVQYRSIIDNTSDRSHGSSATIGLENSAGNAGVQYAYHNSSAIASEQAILFTPSGSTYTLNSSATYDGVYLTKNISLPEPGIPSLISPANNGVIGASHTFQWSAASNASSYTLKISSNSDISGSTDYNPGTNTTFDVSGLALNSTYYWAVFANNTTGTTWSEIYKFTTSPNPPLTPIPQTVWLEQGEERTIKLQYTGGDASTKTAYITSLPAQGALYQYISGSKGSLISSVPALVSDAGQNVIYTASGGSGNGAGNFNFYIHDNTGNSPSGTLTINVNPPGVPNFLLAAKSGNIEIQFDKPMSDPTGKESQFTVKVNGTPVTISSVSLKPGDPYTIVVTLATALTGSETVLISYTQGDVSAESGGLLPSFVDQPVNFLIQTITFPALPVMTFGDAPATLSATASSGLAVTFTSSNTSVATLSGTTLTANSPGTAEITAQQIGNGTYAPARYIRTLTVNKASQTITFPVLPAKTYGDPDFSPGATSTSGLPVTYSSDNEAIAVITGSTIHITGAGTAVITASQEGNNLYNAANNTISTLTVGKADQTITFNAIPAKIITDPDFNPGAVSSSGLAVTYASSDPSIASVTGNTLHLVAAGTATITASQPGDSNHNAALPVSQLLTVGRGSQSITFDALPAVTFGDPDFDPGATSGSLLSVTYASSNSSVATISGGLIHITGAGSTIITASQAGNETYDPAPDVQQTLTVNKASQAITFAALQSKTFGDPDFDPLATSSSSLAVTYSSSNPSVATVAGNMIHITGAGSAVITAAQAGDDNFLAAPGVTQDLLVVKAAQTITFPPLPGGTYGGPDITPEAISSSGLPVTYTSSDPSVAIISGGVIQVTGAGSAVITASQAGNDDYEAAAGVQQDLIAGKADQVIDFSALAPAAYGSPDIDPAATASSGLPVTYSSSNTSVAVISGTMIHIAAAGTAVITASQPGDANHNPAPDVQQTLVVEKADQAVTFSPLPEHTYGDPPFDPGATASSGLPVEYASSDPSIAGVTGNIITIYGAGTVTITAMQPGNKDYNAAPDATLTLTVAKADQTIGFPALQQVVYGAGPFSPGASSSSGAEITYSSDNPSVAEISGSIIQVRGAGTAVITASLPGSDNYNPGEDVVQTLIVTKATLTVTADDKSKAFLTMNPGLTITYSGFAYNDDESVIDVLPAISTTALQDSPVGDYSITVEGGSDDNYDFVYVDGVLTITRIPQTVIFTAYPDKLFAGETYELQAEASSGLPVLFASEDPQVGQVTGSVLKGVAKGTVTIRAYQEGDENYLPAEAVISVEIASSHNNILNLFTPNNDGFNDYWEIPDLDTYGKCNVKVYNRWGQLVFSSADYHNEWDGTSNGSPLPSAAYYYIIKTENSGTITGTVNIVR